MAIREGAPEMDGDKKGTPSQVEGGRVVEDSTNGTGVGTSVPGEL